MSNIAIRWSELLLIVGAALLVAALFIALSTPEITQQLPPLANTLMFPASILLLLSLPAMYARQAKAAGWLGLIGHALLQIGIPLFVLVSGPPLLYSSFDRPFENSLTAFLLSIALTLGLLMTSIATLRAGVFPIGLAYFRDGQAFCCSLEQPASSSAPSLLSGFRAWLVRLLASSWASF